MLVLSEVEGRGYEGDDWRDRGRGVERKEGLYWVRSEEIGHG